MFIDRIVLCKATRPMDTSKDQGKSDEHNCEVAMLIMFSIIDEMFLEVLSIKNFAGKYVLNHDR